MDLTACRTPVFFKQLSHWVALYHKNDCVRQIFYTVQMELLAFKVWLLTTLRRHGNWPICLTFRFTQTASRCTNQRAALQTLLRCSVTLLLDPWGWRAWKPSSIGAGIEYQDASWRIYITESAWQFHCNRTLLLKNFRMYNRYLIYAFYRAMHFSANARSCDRMSSVRL